ncbi:uncharacterized protein B0J16DRAFT_362559 [Fusarium flagelliforme]|uniref:uncharacterized protein n=1 Tax=Fusarium flagelliforme TaxID=2675880 RepID=UPI001E8ED4C4|nr:uncharacterized protein B0J16DRAFT_362559 [Fusarium flagelliforme]KAH7184938.1 hypothetical protein B0J16DRAFT_362559 [Fusarium flagelliforme]
MASLDTLPNEILFQILRDSSPQELCRLSYTCRKMGAIASVCLWSDIEFHEEGYHESSAEVSEPPPWRTSRRPYNSSTRDGWQSDICKRAEKFFTLLQSLHRHDQARLRQLSSRVRSLCTVIEPGWGTGGRTVENAVSIWCLLPYFTNLRALEFHGGSSTSPNDVSGSCLLNAPHLASLAFAKLFAYIPREVATYVLRSSPTLKRLELGMLNDPMSIHSGIDLDDNANRMEGRTSLGGVIPRPLGGFLPGHFTSFPRLKHLYLCQPCNSRGDHFNQMNFWSKQAEQDSLESWKSIILASSQTLETLVLDQRPGAGVEENEGFSEEEFLNTGVTGAGNKALVEAFRNMISSDTALPSLKQVYLYGFIVRSRLRRGLSGETPADRLLDGLEGRGVKCEARRGKWCLFDQDTGTTSWAKWDGDGCSNLHDMYMGVRWYTLLTKV